MAIKLLLADESITIRKVFQKSFSGNDYELAWIDRVDNFADSLQRLKPDFLFLAENFPGISPDTDMSKISSDATTPCRIIIMGHRLELSDSGEQSLPAGVSGFISKPVDNRIIKNLLDKLLQKTVPNDTLAKSKKLGVPEADNRSVDQRADILFNMFQSYFDENIMILTDSLSRSLAPKIAADIASKVIEHLEITDLPKQIMTMTKGIVHDLVPQITERVVAREIESIKTEAIRLLEDADENETDNV